MARRGAGAGGAAKAAVKKAAVKKGATGKAAAKKVATKKIATKKPEAKKPAAKSAAATRTASKKAAAKKTATKPGASKPAAPKPAAPKRTVANAAAAKKAPAKRTAPAATRPARESAAAFPREPRIDAYIDKAAPFAQPILRELRERVHAACPSVQEAIKWGMPAFVYRGKILCGMAAFKRHASFNLWHGAHIAGLEPSKSGDAMGQFGALTALSDLPGRRELAAMLKQAMALTATGVKRPASVKPPPRAPADLAAALAAEPAARATFDAFPPSQQREYVEWVETARREETRRARVAQAVEWMAQGKARNWKYMAKRTGDKNKA
ncbi:iron chaperone [Lysobacter enzymogenes]|uniref:iron chaperone n=1 Tax=Lysobacter enzymogenes TaxID=69 RepID=UPI0038507B57